MILLLAAGLVTVGCSDDDDLGNPWGEEENPDNYGVYFPTQTSSTDLQVESGDDTEVTYRICRSNIFDDIIVPYVLTVYADGEEIENPEEIFQVEPIVFYEGEDETKFTVSFPDASIGTEYTCNIRIEDPDYVAIYGQKTTGLSFTLLRANWNLLGTGKWRDDIISSIYSGITYMNAEIDVDIYEREDLPGYYRMQAFGSTLAYALFGRSMTTDESWTFVDASNPDEVWFPRQSTGFTVNSSDGAINIASNVDKIFSMDASENEYGTLVDGVITFPAGGILGNLPGYDATGWYATNTSGLHRIMLPGARDYDYTVTLTASEASNGIVSVDVALGEDTKLVRYKVYEGAFDDAQASLYAQELDEDQSAFEGSITEDGTLEVSGLETGKYTLVACTYDETGETMRGYSFVSFGYVADGDDCPIILTFGLEATNEYAGMGVSTDNSVKFYAYGEGIESLKVAMYRTSKIEGSDWRELVEDYGTEFTDDQLSEVNSGHFSTMLTSLNGDSEYTLLLLASNGYITELYTATYKTTGTFNPLLESYSYSDFLEDQPSKSELFATTWSLYGVDLMDDDPEFRRIGEVIFEEDTSEDYSSSGQTIDYIRVYGLTGATFDSEDTGLLMPYIPGTSTYLLYDGAFGVYATSESVGKIGGSSVYSGFIALEDGSNLYTGVGMFAGEVADGYMAFVPNPQGIEQGYTFTYYCTFDSYYVYTLLYDMILADDAMNPSLSSVSMEGTFNSRKEYYKTLKAIIEEMEWEKIGPMRPIEDILLDEGYDVQALSRPANLAVGFLPASAPEAVAAGATFNFLPGVSVEKSISPLKLSLGAYPVYRSQN